MSYLNTFVAAGLTAGLLFTTACGPKGQPAEDSSEASTPKTVTIPDGPDAAIATIIQEVSKANGGILWQAMPDAYQADLTEVVQLAGSKVDAEVYDKVASVVSRLGGIARDKQEFIFNTSLGGEPMPDKDKAKMQEAWPAVVALIDAVSGSQLGSVEGLQSFDGQQFFGGTVSDILKQVDRLSSLSAEPGSSLAELGQIVVSVVEASDSEASLKLVVPHQPEEIESFTKVDGKWLPTEIVTEWSAQMAEAKAMLEALTPEAAAESKAQTMMMVGMIEGILGQVEAAQTQEQFDAAIQGAMMPIMMMGMQMGGALGAGAAPEMPQGSAVPEAPALPLQQ